MMIMLSVSDVRTDCKLLQHCTISTQERVCKWLIKKPVAKAIIYTQACIQISTVTGWSTKHRCKLPYDRSSNTMLTEGWTHSVQCNCNFNLLFKSLTCSSPLCWQKIYGKYGTVTKHSCIVAKLAYAFLLSYWFDNMFRPLYLGHHQVYKMFIRAQVNYCFL